MKSTIRLFRSLPIYNTNASKVSVSVLTETVKRGFIFSPEVFSNYTDDELIEKISIIEKYIGLTALQMNISFHKSWNKVANAPTIQLLMEQYVHYITTYGFEKLNIYNENLVYIPNEELNLPPANENIMLTVIKGYTKSELKNKLITLLQSGIALSDDTIHDCIELFTYLKLSENELSMINNKEVRAKLYDLFDIIPSNAEEFLRFILYKLTKKTLLIKNQETYKSIKVSNIDVTSYFNRYIQANGVNKLSEIFYRYKLIFLALKQISDSENMKYIINKIRKFAIHNHKPFKGDYLNDITSNIKLGKSFSESEMIDKLKSVNSFRKIRLLYALKYRLSSPDCIVYKIRNGKSYASEFSVNDTYDINRAYNIVYKSLLSDINDNVKNKKIYLPESIKYALPATEKQFTGNIPSGTHISLSSDMIIGVYWNDVDYSRVDLDLSMIDQSEKIGWDGKYRDGYCEILFSGDMTAAPDGASELFYIKNGKYGAYALMLNHYNREDEISVPFKIVIGKEKVDDLCKNYMIDPNNVILTVDSKIKEKQKMLGLLYLDGNSTNFYFSETNIGRSISAGIGSQNIRKARSYSETFHKNIINLNDILHESDCVIVSDRTEADIDLSIDTIEKDTILNLFTKKLKNI